MRTDVLRTATILMVLASLTFAAPAAPPRAAATDAKPDDLEQRLAALEQSVRALTETVASLPGGNIKKKSISAKKLADAAITARAIADGAVGAGKIASGAVGPDQIADDAVTARAIAEGAVGAGKIASGAVGPDQIAHQAITSDKLGPDAVGSFELQDRVDLGTSGSADGDLRVLNQNGHAKVSLAIDQTDVERGGGIVSVGKSDQGTDDNKDPGVLLSADEDSGRIVVFGSEKPKVVLGVDHADAGVISVKTNGVSPQGDPREVALLRASGDNGLCHFWILDPDHNVLINCQAKASATPGKYASLIELNRTGSTPITLDGDTGIIYAGQFVSTSSRRWKENVETAADALHKICTLRGVYFDWKDSKKHDVGMIAEEVAEVVPEVIAFEQDGKPRAIDYGRLTSLLVEAIKSQQAQIDEQSRLFREQREQLEAQQTRIDALLNARSAAGR